MFADGLHNRVDIYFLNRDNSNRTSKEKIKISRKPNLQNVPCRIIKDKKIIFKGILMLEDGYTLQDIESKTVYEIKGGDRIRGIFNTHHSSYEIKIKGASVLNE